MSAAGQSLEMKPGGARGLGRVGRDAPGAGDQQHVRRRRLEAQPLADLGARLLADEQVDERDVRLVAAGQRQRLLAVARAQAALDPGLLAEHQPEAPVHDLVVVDDQHAQPAVAGAGRDPAGVDVRHAHAAPPVAPARFPARARRTRRGRRPAAPRSPRAGAPSRCRRRGRAADAVVAHLHHPGAVLLRRAAPRPASAARASRALRTASASTDCASPSSARGHADVRAARREHDAELGVLARSRSTSSCERRRRLARRAPERALQRPAQVAQRGLELGRRRARARRGVELGVARDASSTPNSRWITLSWTSRARSIRSCSLRARACWNGRGARASASAATLPSVHSRLRSLARRAAARGARSAEDHAAPAPAGGDRHADEHGASRSSPAKRSGTSRAAVTRPPR